MLMSEKVKTWNSNLYPHLIKTINNHYRVSGIAYETQQCLDRGIKSDNTISHNTAYYTHRPQRSSRGNVPIKQKQPLRTSRQPRHTNTTTIRHTDRNHNPKPAICKNYTRGRACFHARNPPYRPSPLAQAHVTATDDDTPPINIKEQGFRYEPDEIWWLVPSSPTLAIIYSSS